MAEPVPGRAPRPPHGGNGGQPAAKAGRIFQTAATAAGRTRDRRSTEERILGAVGEVLAREGFGAIGVNSVARHAGVDKVLIYRYFGGLPGLLRRWGESGRFWPRVVDLLGDDPDAVLGLPPAERYARFFEHFVAELRSRPLALEILAAEVVERNELTEILEAEREAWGEEVLRVLGGTDLAARPFLRDVALLLVAGIQYLLLRSRRLAIYGGIDLRSDEDWRRLVASIRDLAVVAFAPAPAEAARSAPRSAGDPALRPRPRSAGTSRRRS